jgi:hypothetical protein
MEGIYVMASISAIWARKDINNNVGVWKRGEL